MSPRWPPLSWSKLMGLVGWLVWLVKTNCWVSPERRFLTSPTHPPPLHKCRGQSHKSRPELFYPFYNHSWTLPLASYILLLRFQYFFHLTKSLVIFFNHPRRPVLVVTVLAVCTDGPALCTLHATVAWMLDATPPLGLRTSEKRGNGKTPGQPTLWLLCSPRKLFLYSSWHNGLGWNLERIWENRGNT